MQDLMITRTNGNIVRTLAGEDHVSGLVFYSANYPIPAPDLIENGNLGFVENDPIHMISSIETAEKYGIKNDVDTPWEIKVLHYTLASIFKINPGISLYVGIFPHMPQVTDGFVEILQMQHFAEGRLRQVGVWNGAVELSESLLNSLQSMRTTLEQRNMPLSILYAPKVTNVASLPLNIAKIGRNGVSVVIAQDGDGVAASLYHASANKTNKASVSALGDLLGAVSRAKVNQSIAWVEEFPTNIAVAAFGDGTKYRDYDTAVIEELDNARYIFCRTYEGLAGTYFNDNHTLDIPTSDYAYINDVRTMDKAVRGARTYLLPKLGRPMKVDASTGKLERTAVEHLITTGNKPLEEMEKAGELSGYKFEIDPDQNILASSRIRGVIKNVAVGVMRNLDLEIGYATSV